ncbi:2-hydroxychromene-2-carboxylate isomerase [Terasakiella brassicae]|uniref:2-hydroxychromene-2-carboxylate isomerase n=1 Tax=Terasakiella brassicae TaxID=1634917 RepID=A0A917C1V4_9PROT|nr:2-hydroxychromene-2-carboxylate isomerase [Terasakiella brassicae]GGF63988.1 2-hydroxychromene-2-carboxylate isomerase [Terasakiella brassicae]
MKTVDPRPIEFYFDFSSPYAYLTSTWMNELAEKYGRQVIWRPIMLGVVFQETGMRPLFHQPLRGPYGERDFLRTARLLGRQAVVPKEFPYVSLAVSRAFYWLEDHHNEVIFDFAHAVFARYFEDGIAPTTHEDVARLAIQVGVDPDKLIEGCQDPQVKARLKDETAQAIEKGVFGAPFIIVDAEPFWGNDRKDQIEEWLKTGGW